MKGLVLFIKSLTEQWHPWNHFLRDIHWYAMTIICILGYYQWVFIHYLKWSENYVLLTILMSNHLRIHRFIDQSCILMLLCFPFSSPMPVGAYTLLPVPLDSPHIFWPHSVKSCRDCMGSPSLLMLTGSSSMV